MEIPQENMCLNLFLITLQAFRPGTLLKMDFNTGVFIVKFAKVFKNTCFEEYLRMKASNLGNQLSLFRYSFDSLQRV